MRVTFFFSSWVALSTSDQAGGFWSCGEKGRWKFQGLKKERKKKSWGEGGGLPTWFCVTLGLLKKVFVIFLNVCGPCDR